MTRPQDWIGWMEPDSRIGRLRLWLARRLCPDSHRVVEIGDIVTDPRMALSDLYAAIQSLEAGFEVHPMILVNAARLLRDGDDRQMLLAEIESLRFGYSVMPRGSGAGSKTGGGRK